MLVVTSSFPFCLKVARIGRQLVSQPEWARVRPIRSKVYNRLHA